MPAHVVPRGAGRVLVMLVGILLASCGGGGGGTGPTAPADASVMGLWTITETSKTSSNTNCEPPNDPLSPSIVFITQDGIGLTLMFGANLDGTMGTRGGVLTGTITSGAVSITGSHLDGNGDGTTTLNPMSATVDGSCNSLTGSASFSFTQTTPSPLSCTGTTQFSGTRTVGSGCTGTINNALVAEQGTDHNTSATAQTIALSSRVDGALPVSDVFTPLAYDWYRLVLLADGPVTIMLTGPVDQDIDLFLFAGDGTTMIGQSGSITSGEALSQNLAAGTYFILVQPFDVTSASIYSLVVQ